VLSKDFLPNEPLFQLSCDKNLRIYTVNNHTHYDVFDNEETGEIEIIDKSSKEEDSVIAGTYSSIAGDKKYRLGYSYTMIYHDLTQQQWELVMLVSICAIFIPNRKLRSIKKKSRTTQYDGG